MIERLFHFRAHPGGLGDLGKVPLKGRPGPRCGERRAVLGCGGTWCPVARPRKQETVGSGQLAAVRKSAAGLPELFFSSVMSLLSRRRFPQFLAPSTIQSLPGHPQGPSARPQPQAFILNLSAAEVHSDWPTREPGPRGPLLERGEGEEAARVTVRKRVSL